MNQHRPWSFPREKFGLGTPGTVITFPSTLCKQLRVSDEFAEDDLQ
jgi:hypothetical protein